MTKARASRWGWEGSGGTGLQHGSSCSARESWPRHPLQAPRRGTHTAAVDFSNVLFPLFATRSPPAFGFSSAFSYSFSSNHFSYVEQIRELFVCLPPFARIPQQ